MIDSLSPTHVPRRSGIAVSAVAGTARSAASREIQASFDTTGLLSATGDVRPCGDDAIWRNDTRKTRFGRSNGSQTRSAIAKISRKCRETAREPLDELR